MDPGSDASLAKALKPCRDTNDQWPAGLQGTGAQQGEQPIAQEQAQLQKRSTGAGLK